MQAKLCGTHTRDSTLRQSIRYRLLFPLSLPLPPLRSNFVPNSAQNFFLFISKAPSLPPLLLDRNNEVAFPLAQLWPVLRQFIAEAVHDIINRFVCEFGEFHLEVPHHRMLRAGIRVWPLPFCVLVAHRRIAGLRSRHRIIAKFRALPRAELALRRLTRATRANNHVVSNLTGHFLPSLPPLYALGHGANRLTVVRPSPKRVTRPCLSMWQAWHFVE